MSDFATVEQTARFVWPATFGAADDTLETSGGECWENWTELIAKVSRWHQSTADFEEAEIVPPTAVSIERAKEVAGWFRKSKIPGKPMAVPSGNGGVAFEFRFERDQMLINIRADGSVFGSTFRDSRLVERVQLL